MKKRMNEKLNNILIYSLFFLMIAFVGYKPLWENNYSLIWNVDGIGQYYPAFLYVGQYLQNFFNNILHGSFSVPLYDLSIAMGEDIIGVLNYYGFGDPVNLLAIFANENNGVYWYTITYFLRIWLAGLSFQAYCREMRMDSYVSVLGSLAYAFCGFALYGGGRYIEWLSVLVYFPLFLLGTEKILKEKKKFWILVLSVTYGAFCGFYYLYMASLSLGIYWIIRLIAVYGIKQIKMVVLNGMSLAGSYLLGLGISAPVFLTSVSAFFNSERSGGGIGEVLFNIENYIPIKYENWFIVLFDFFHYRLLNFSGVLFVETIALLLLFTIRGKRAFQLKIAIAISFVALHLPITGWLFNAFGETNDRWVFFIHFLLALVLTYVLTEVKNIEIENKDVRIKIINRKTMVIVVSGLVIFNIIANVRLLYSNENLCFGWINEMVDSNRVERYVDSPVNYSKILKEDDGLYRVTNTNLTKINGRPENVAMLNDYNGATWWYSIINADTQTSVNELLQMDIGWRSFGLRNNSVFETFAGVKYYLARESEGIQKDWICVEQVEFNDEIWNVYQNPLWFGLAYVRDKQMSGELWEKKASYQDYYEQVYNQYITGREEIKTTYERNKDRFICTVDTEQDEEVIILIPYHKNWKAYVDGVKVNTEKTDLMYISVIPGEGEHEIILKYESTEFKVGMVIASISLIICKRSIKRCHNIP